MRKSELIQSAAILLREADARKPFRSPKHILHVSDDDGNCKDFVIKQTEGAAIYTKRDVALILDACTQVLCDALKRGDSVTISGIGTIGLIYRKPRETKIPGTDQPVAVPGRFYPKLTPGHRLKLSAKLYELSLSDHVEDGTLNDDDLIEDDGFAEDDLSPWDDDE